MKPGPSMKSARYRHGCARLRDGSIIIAGGNHGSKSTEILKIGDHEWKNGPDLKEGVKSNEVVKSILTKDMQKIKNLHQSKSV